MDQSFLKELFESHLLLLLLQLLDLLDLKDYPIVGYNLPKILTELHLHLCSCAVDYRPEHLPYRALLLMETFSVCSNVLAEAHMSVLHFTVDDASLYLASDTAADSIDMIQGERLNEEKKWLWVFDKWAHLVARSVLVVVIIKHVYSLEKKIQMLKTFFF